MNLHSLHPSIAQKPKGRPRNLSSMRIPTELRLTIETECLSIFTSMVNAGASLQQILTAVYLSGMSAAEGAKE